MSEIEFNTESSEPVREELVAYLDGELDDADCVRVESRLEDDENYRAELQRLGRAWDCLDLLPSTRVEEHFARSTAEMIVVEASQDVARQQAELPARRRTQVLLTVAVLVASAAAGYVLASAVWPSGDKSLVRDLPMLENLDLYLQIDEVAFLRKLMAQRPLDGGFTESADPPPASEVDQPDAQRRSRLEAMSPEAKADLAAKRERFRSLLPAVQDRVRRIHRELVEDRQSQELLSVLAQYHAFVKDLSPGQRADLLALAHDERIEALRRFHAEQAKRRMVELSADDAQVLLGWLDEYLNANLEKLLSVYPSERRASMARRLREAGPMQRRAFILGLMSGRAAMGRPFAPLPIEQAEMERVVASLSPESQSNFAQSREHDKEKILFRTWIREAVQGGRGHGPSVREEDLEAFFVEKLNSEQRQQLLVLPQEEMERELRKQYFEEFYQLDPGRPEGRFRGGPFPPRRGSDDHPHFRPQRDPNRPPPPDPRLRSGRPPGV